MNSGKKTAEKVSDTRSVGISPLQNEDYKKCANRIVLKAIVKSQLRRISRGFTLGFN